MPNEGSARETARLHDAQLRLPAAPEGRQWDPASGLTRTQWATLTRAPWWPGYPAVLITGPTGVGKTYALCALGHAACRQANRVRSVRLARWLGEAVVAHQEQRWLRWLRWWSRIDLVLVDDWRLAPWTAPESCDWLEFLDDRWAQGAAAIARRVPVPVPVTGRCAPAPPCEFPMAAPRADGECFLWTWEAVPWAPHRDPHARLGGIRRHPPGIPGDVVRARLDVSHPRRVPSL